MKISPRGIALIKQFEGFSATPYLCPAGYLTIGYGHLVKHEQWNAGITQDVAERLLYEDVVVAESAVARLIKVSLTQQQYDALVSFTFNLGAGALQRSTLRRRVNQHDEAAAQEFHKWIFAGGIRLSGLILRRKAEAELYTKSQ